MPRYNIAPRTQVPVLRRRDNGPNDQPDLILQTMKWGLVPHWSKHEDKTLSTTNARAENLVEGGGMWGSLRGTKRCVIPCQGYPLPHPSCLPLLNGDRRYYEWLSKGKQKVPYYTKRKDGGIMLLAGLYDSAVIEGNGQSVTSKYCYIERKAQAVPSGHSLLSLPTPTRTFLGYTTVNP